MRPYVSLVFLLLLSCSHKVIVNVPVNPCPFLTWDSSREVQDCALIKNEFAIAKSLYVNGLGTPPEVDIERINIWAAPIDHIDARGVPVFKSGGDFQQAYIASNGSYIFYANPYAVRCEVLHLLRLIAGFADWDVIGHDTLNDPLHLDCSNLAVQAYLTRIPKE